MLEFLLLITGIMGLLFFRPAFRKIAEAMEDKADRYQEDSAIETAIERQESYNQLVDYMSTNNIVKLHQHADIMRIVQGK